MKIYNKIVVNMESNEIISEDSFEYKGKITECSGGGSSGGGGGSGKIEYPGYMEDQHGAWMTAVDADMTTARSGNSPFFGAVASDPAANLTAMDTAVCAFNTVVDALNNETDWASAMTQAQTTIDALISDAYINADVAAFADLMDDQIDNVTIPKFQRGMQDINAVQSSAFALGEALIYGMRDRDVAKYTSDLRLKSSLQRNELITKSASEMLQALLTRVELEKAVAHYSIEYNRLSIVACKEQTDRNLEIEEIDARWDLEMFQYGANMMASIAGGTVSTGEGGGVSKTQSALGGALSGAAAGASIPGAGLAGAAAGAVIGGLASFL